MHRLAEMYPYKFTAEDLADVPFRRRMHRAARRLCERRKDDGELHFEGQPAKLRPS